MQSVRRAFGVLQTRAHTRQFPRRTAIRFPFHGTISLRLRAHTFDFRNSNRPFQMCLMIVPASLFVLQANRETLRSARGARSLQVHPSFYEVTRRCSLREKRARRQIVFLSPKRQNRNVECAITFQPHGKSLRPCSLILSHLSSCFKKRRTPFVGLVFHDFTLPHKDTTKQRTDRLIRLIRLFRAASAQQGSHLPQLSNQMLRRWRL